MFDSMHTLSNEERESNAAGDACVSLLPVDSQQRSIDWCESEIGLVVQLFAFRALSFDINFFHQQQMESSERCVR